MTTRTILADGLSYTYELLGDPAVKGDPLSGSIELDGVALATRTYMRVGNVDAAMLRLVLEHNKLEAARAIERRKLEEWNQGKPRATA